MKKLFLVSLLFCFVNGFAQSKSKADSIYYLLDTLKTPANERLWETHLEYPSVKLFSIQCSCLQYDNKPTFVYSLTDKSQNFDRKRFKTIKLITLSDLIDKSKQATADYSKGQYKFFLIEPAGKAYRLHEVRLLRPTKSRGTSVDYETIKQQ